MKNKNGYEEFKPETSSKGQRTFEEQQGTIGTPVKISNESLAYSIENLQIQINQRVDYLEKSYDDKFCTMDTNLKTIDDKLDRILHSKQATIHTVITILSFLVAFWVFSNNIVGQNNVMMTKIIDSDIGKAKADIMLVIQTKTSDLKDIINKIPNKGK